MKAKLRTEIVRVAYWSCAIKTHRHKTEEVATECIKKWPTAPQKRTISTEWENGGYELLLSRRRSGISVKILAEQYKKSGSRIRQLLKRAEALERWRERNGDVANINGMSSVGVLAIQTRTLNCLKSEYISCIDDLVQHTETRLLAKPNIGRKVLNDIKEALAEIGFHLAER